MSRIPLVTTALFAVLIAFVDFLFLSLVPLGSPPEPAMASDRGLSDRPDNALECGATWTREPSPNVGEHSGLSSVAALSANSVWAVGYSQDSSYKASTLTEHWDGETWSVVSSPNVGTTDNVLSGVAAISDSDVWAVGNYQATSSYSPSELIEHWNGSTWSIIDGASPAQYSSLSSVVALSSNDVWAVGISMDGSRTSTLTEHWNGTEWSVVPSPDVHTQNSYLNSVAAFTSSDIWAVGSYAVTTRNFQTLTEHWDGSRWSVIGSANANRNNSLLGISGASGDDIWAVGSQGYSGDALTEHWNGSAWSVVTTPPVNEAAELRSIVAVSGDDVWAVGVSLLFGRFENDYALLEHWDGSAWSVFHTSDFGNSDYLNGVASVPGGELWAVGSEIAGPYYTLTARYHPDPCAPTATPAATVTATPTATATPAPPRCPGERFTDVCPGDYFYQHVLDLNDLGVVSGYTTIPPCQGEAYVPCYKPENSTTRGQIAKIVSLAAGFSEDVTGQTFADVSPDSTFYQYIERMAARGIITGYPCGGANEPCDSENRPYFRPGNTVSRGQLSKMGAVAFGFDEALGVQNFEDVLPGSTYYDYIWRLNNRGIISGYPCGGAGEPCGAGNLPYFRPAHPVTRGQIAKIVNLARLQLSPTPTPTPAITLTPEVTYTPTAIDTATVTTTPTSVDTSVPTMTATPTPFSTETSTSTATPTP